MRIVKLYPGDEIAHLAEVPATDGDPERYLDVIDRPIDYRSLGPGWGMFFDDEFLMKSLPLNLLGTMLYRAAGYGSAGNGICGPVVVVGMTEDGTTVDLPQEALDAMRTKLGFMIVQEVE